MPFEAKVNFQHRSNNHVKVQIISQKSETRKNIFVSVLIIPFFLIARNYKLLLLIYGFNINVSYG